MTRPVVGPIPASWRANLALRVAMLAALAVGLAVAVIALTGYVAFRHQLYGAIDDSLYERATQAAVEGNTDDIAPSAPDWLPGAADMHIRQLFADGTYRSSDPLNWTKSAPLWGQPELAVARGAKDESIRTIRTEYGRFRVVAVPISGQDSALVLAQSLEPVLKALHGLALVLAAFGGVGMVAAGIAGWLVARNGLRPVRRLTFAAEEIARTEVLEPMPVEGNDEVARLTIAFNHMLSALEASRDRQRQLVADAGHELRTPLTSLRTNIDLLAQSEQRGGLQPQQKSELLDDVQFQIEELTTLIGDLTELARDEPINVAVTAVDFDELVVRAVERVRRRGADLHFDVHLDQWWVIGEQTSLERAVTNLLDNAAKWSPPGGTIKVVLDRGTLTVSDEGPGIDEADLPYIFERFYRSAGSRTMPGSGLGLAIVRQIFSRHGGEVWVSATGPDGTTMTATIPGSEVEPKDNSRLTAGT